MALCVSGCIKYDENSGLLTINQADLGGLECTSEGQRIRIAGNTQGISASDLNNGLFMTVAGELGALKTPQVYGPKSGIGSTNVSTNNVAPGTYGPYAATNTVTYTNPSNNHPMVVWIAAYFKFTVVTRYGNSQASSFTLTPRFTLNGVASPLIGHAVENIATSNIGGSTTPTHVVHYTTSQVVAPGSSLTINASQYWTVAGTSGLVDFHTANTMLNTFAVQAPRVP